MSYVNHKTNTPGGSDLYGYAFLTLPNPKTPSNPKGVTIDGKILPARDIHDLSAGTNTWKEMHGVDLYFLEEAVAERQYATTQFSSSRGTRAQWPASWQQWITWDGGYIWAWYWRQICGRWDETGQTTTYSGIGQFYKQHFLDISSASQLPNDIMTWKDGSDIELYIPNGLGYPHAGQYCYNYLADVIAPLDQSMMISHVADFNNGNPLSAQSIRNLYKDLERLQFYTLSTATTVIDEEMTSSDAYKSQVWTAAWYKTETDYSQWGSLYIDPDAPTNGWSATEVINEASRAFGTQGQSGYNGMYEICESDYGYYRIPYCGKTASGYNSIFGSEVAVYVCLRMEWWTSYYDQQTTKFGFFKMSNYTLNRSLGYIELDAVELVSAGYRLIDKYNARIPRQAPASWREDCSTHVEIEKIYLVCKLTDRTNTTQLNWNKRPQ